MSDTANVFGAPQGASTTPPASSVVGILADRHDEIVASQQLRYQIPRWTKPTVFVVFHPVDHAEFKRGLKAIDRTEKMSKGNVSDVADAELKANAQLLVHAASETFIVDDSGNDVGFGDDGAMHGIDHPSTATALGFPADTPPWIVCCKLFITDGDLMACASKLVEWSGYSQKDADEAIRGE